MPDAGQRGIANVVVVGPVGVDVDESRHREAAGGIDDRIGGGQLLTGLEHGGNFAGFDDERTVFEIEVRRHNAGVVDERFHG